MKWLRLAGCAVVFAAPLSACSTGGSASNLLLRTPATCTAPMSSPVHDSVQGVLTGSADKTALIRSLEARLRLTGAICPSANLTPATAENGMAPPAGALSLHLHWTGTAGEDPRQSTYESSFVLRSGNLALRPVVSDLPGDCTEGNINLSGTSTPNISSAGRCLHLGAAIRDHLVAVSGTAAPTADPSIWTVTLRLDERANAGSLSGKAMFASVDGFGLGKTTIVGGTLTARGHFDGQGTEARSVVSNVVIPIPEIDGYAVVS